MFLLKLKRMWRDLSFDSDTEGSGPSSLTDVRTSKFCLFELKKLGPFEGKVPKDRSGHRIVYYKGKVYSFGGYNPAVDLDDPDLEDDAFWPSSKPLFRELWELNLISKQWKKLEMSGRIPEQLASHTAIMHPLVPSTMIVYGGTGAPFGQSTSNTVYNCCLRTAEFKEMETDGDHPMALYGQATVIDKSDNMMYTVGGTSGFHYYMDVHRLNLNCQPAVWKKLYEQHSIDEEPHARYRHELALLGKKLFVLGGGTSFSADRFEYLPTFDLRSNKWSYTKTKPDLATTIDQGDGLGFPEARRCHGATQMGDKVFIFGGYDGDDIFGDFWRLDLTTLEWRRLPLDLTLPVYFHASTITEEGKVVVFGGVDNVENNSRTNSVYTGWLAVPSLRALSWEALTTYVPNIAAVPPSKLLEEGVPRDCVSLLHPTLAECG